MMRTTAAGNPYDAGSITRSHLAPTLERLVHGEFVGVLEVAADRHANGDTRHADAERLEQARQVNRRRFTIDIRVGGQNYFGDAVLYAREQPLDLQVIGPDPLERRQRAH